MSERITKGIVLTYRAGVVAGLGAIGYMLSMFVTKEQFAAYRESSKEIGSEQVKRLDQKIDDVRSAQIRIETKLDRALSRRDASASIPKVGPWALQIDRNYD